MIEQLARRFLADLKTVLPESTRDLPEKEIRSLLEGVLRSMNLVPRAEFDAQQAVLARTREQVDTLERRLAELEAELSAEPETAPEQPDNDTSPHTPV